MAGRTKVKYQSTNSSSFSKLIPHLVTLSAMVLGLTSVKYAMMGRFDKAVSYILIASVLDLSDGIIARALGISSSFGMTLDSLSDIVTFGVCSPLVLYIWGTKDVKFFGWAIVLLFATSIAIRLAQYQINSTESKNPIPIEIRRNFFQGIPSPAGALYSLIPIYIWIEFSVPKEKLLIPSIILSFIICIGAISKTPTFAFRRFKVTKKNAFLTLGIFSMCLISFVLETTKTLLFLSPIYTISIIFSILEYRKIQKEYSTE